jgi:hypothetical protein
MSSRYDDDRYSAASQDGADMTGGMEIPSRLPPKSSPKKHRHHRTKVPEIHHEEGDDYEDDDGKSNVSGASRVSERTKNTREIISGTSLSPKAGPYNPYADLPLRSTPTKVPTPRSTTRPAHLEVNTAHHQSDRLRPPPSGPSGRSDDLGRGYSRSPGGRSVHYETEGQPPPSGPTRSRGSRDDTPSRGYGQPLTSPSDKHGLRFPKVHMPQLEDYVVPSASARGTPQFGKTSSRDQRDPLPSGYAKPSQPNTAADYEDARVESPNTQERVDQRRSSRGSYPERTGDEYRRDSRASASPTNTRQPYQATSPREGTMSPISPLSAPRQMYSQSPTSPGRPDPYLAQVANATEEKASRRDSGMTSPRSIPMPARPSRLSVSSQNYGNSPNTPSSVKSPLGQRPVRTYGDGLDRRESNLSPNSAYGRDGYFASRSPNLYSSPIDQTRSRPKAVYKNPFEEESDEAADEQLIAERKRQPRAPASPASREHSITDNRPSHSRNPSGTSKSLLSPRLGSSAGTPRPGSSTSTREEELDEQIEMHLRNAAMRKARETSLGAWQTRMTNKMPEKRQLMQEELRTAFKRSPDLHRCLKEFGWGYENAVERNEEPIANLSLDFTDAYNNHVAKIYKKYLDQGIPGLPSEDVDIVTSTEFREGKLNWDGLIEDSGCRVTAEFTLNVAGGEPVTRQRRQKYDDLLTTVPPPQVFVPDIGVPKSRKSESRDDHGDRRDRRPEITYDSKHDGGGRSNEMVSYDSKYPDRSEREEGSVASSVGRGRRAYEEVPRQGTLLLVPGETHIRGNSTSTKYVYDTSRGGSRVATRDPSKEPSRGGSRVPSRASSKIRSRAPSGPPSRVPSRAPSRHGPRLEGGEGESGRKHRSKKHGSRTERTESEERERRDKRRDDRRSRH